MTCIDQISVDSSAGERSVALYTGDLAAIPEHEAVDLLVVSAFPNDYTPTPASLIGALHRRGISVANLAEKKAVDLRRFSSCWLSDEIRQPNACFKRLLCFEPLVRGSAPEVVGDLFRSLVPFAMDTPPRSQIAMPVLASGDQGESPSVMLKALLDASLHWLMNGLPIQRIKIVISAGTDHADLAAVFRRAREIYHESRADSSSRNYRFDAFLSYSRKDQSTADYLHEALLASQPSLRLYVDRFELRAGLAWQQHIFEALEDCRKIIPLLSPDYAESKVCKDEFHIGLLRHRDCQNGVLVPIFIRSAALPAYMRLIQFLDAREDDHHKLSAHVEDILKYIRDEE